jgi:predicted nucleic acid-binding protein
MIVLDTSVLVEVLRAEPAPRVMSWLSAQDEHALYTTVFTQAEIMAALALLPEGRRRDALKDAVTFVFSDSFAGRVLPFDEAAATLYPEIIASGARAGMAIRPLDGIVAAIARAHGAALATRNSRDVEGSGIVVHDPWKGR